MTRPVLVLAASLLIASAWTAAQDVSNEPAASVGLVPWQTSAETPEKADDQALTHPSSDPWDSVSWMPNSAAHQHDDRSLPAEASAVGNNGAGGNGAGGSLDFGESINLIGGKSYFTEKCCRNCGAANRSDGGNVDDFGFWVCRQCGCDVLGRPVEGPTDAIRLVHWVVDSNGSKAKVGEFQDLASSPFWEVDGIKTNGSQTFDYSVSGLDQEANHARAYYYGGPNLGAKFKFERFLHRLDHDPLNGFDLNNGSPGPQDKVVSDDVNVGQDYAIRVQQLDAQFHGKLTSNLKWKLNLWEMHKVGERQANAMAHCFNVNPPAGTADYTCHVLSESQRIDWTTQEITPTLEAKFGNAVVEYSRTMRAFGQNDQVVDRTYTAFSYSPTFGTQGPLYDYAWVPENFTQIDRLKLSLPLDCANQLYANLYLGDTEDKFRGTNRNFNGCDVRLTNCAVENVTLTGYAKIDTQNNEIPSSLFTAAPFGVGSGSASSHEPGSLQHLIDYNSARAGIKGKWQSPTHSGFYVAGGYEFIQLARDFADYSTLSGPFTQQDSRTHQINIGPYLRVSPTLDTFIRYKASFTDYPLIGVREADGRFNTNQPTQQHRVELGGTWSPSANFMATGSFGIENSWNNSPYANFNEDNYPIVVTVWYAPTTRWSLTGGYAFLSNWIDQDITIGFQNNPTETTPWNYDGYNNLFSISANYAWTPCTQLVAGIEWDRGSNLFTVPASPAGADWTALASFSDVIAETTRINVGVDHKFAPSTSAYFRYLYFDYRDLSANLDSGTANFFLAGVARTY